MAQFYCFSCDKYFDSKEQDHAIYYPVPICEECVDNYAEQAKQQWWASQDQDEEFTNAG